MLKVEVQAGAKGWILLMDSITKVTAEDEGAIVVSASHGGVSSGEFALAVPLGAVFFNDAGVGKEDAGIAALTMLQVKGIPAGAAAHTSARIGDSQDMWNNGIISFVNPVAAKLGLAPGAKLSSALGSMVSG